MCTVSWLREPDRLEIFFNRDESRLRQPAEPPCIQTQNGVSFIAPVDPDAGGTWMAVNEHGVMVCILNYYQKEVALSAGTFTSRGKLVTSLMDAVSGAEAAQRIRELDLQVFRAFILLVLDRSSEPVRFTWTGESLREETLPAPYRPLTTSSFETEAVIARRNQAFDHYVDRTDQTVDQYLAFHRHREADSDAYSVCMSRPDAHTVSFSRMWVDDATVHFAYFAEGPAQQIATSAVSLPLNREPAGR